MPILDDGEEESNKGKNASESVSKFGNPEFATRPTRSQGLDAIIAVRDLLGLDRVQLHGDEPESWLDDLGPETLSTFFAIHTGMVPALPSMVTGRVAEDEAVEKAVSKRFRLYRKKGMRICATVFTRQPLLVRTITEQ